MKAQCLVVGVRHAVPTRAVCDALASLGIETHVEEWPGPVPRGLFRWAVDLVGRRLPAEPFPDGVWWLETTHGGRWPARTAGTLEMADGEGLTQVRVCRRTGGEATTLRQASFRTDPFSVERQRYYVDLAAVELLTRAARDRLEGIPWGDGVVDRVPAPRGLLGSERRRLARQRWTGWARAQWDDTLRSDRWTLGVVAEARHRFLDPDFRPQPRWLELAPVDVFAADPCVVARPNGVDVYMEHFDYRVGSGEIAVRSLVDGEWGPLRSVVEGPGHVSYPYVYEDAAGRRFATAENAENGVVPRYEVGAEGGWHRAEPMLAFPGLDPTVFEFDGLWWLFATDARVQRMDALHAWYADSPVGPWRPHAANPIKVDVRSSRPAGAPFRHDGHLYRPAQDGRDGYGSAIALCRIDRLTPDAFAETVVARVRPLGGREHGIHTLAGAGGVTVVDGKRRIVVPTTLRERIRGKLDAARRLVLPD